MPRQPSTLFELHTQQQPFTLVHEHEAWHVTFDGHRCELDVHGSRIEAQAIARCYHSLFLAPGAPFAHADLSECEMLDLAEREAAIEIEVQQRRMDALLYGATGDGALPSVRVGEPPARYLAGGTPPGLASDLIGDQLTGHLSALFDLMGIAEDEISAAMVRHQGHARLLWNSFQFMQPGILDKYDSRLFHSHCCEILERIAQAGTFIFQNKKERDHAINRPTAAECLIGVSEASFVAPMHGAGSLAYHLLFHRVYGLASPWPIEIKYDEGGRMSMNVVHPQVTIRMHEQWQGRTDELIFEVRCFIYRRGITSERAQAKDRPLRDIPDHWTPPKPSKASPPQLRLFAA